MTKAEKLKRDIETLQESIRQDWQDLAALNLTPEERLGIRKHLKWCALQLNFLAMQIEIQDEDNA